MAQYALIRNGMGDVDAGTGAEEDDLLFIATDFVYQNGVLASGDCAVSQRGAGANMSVDVAAGRCYVPNSSYSSNTDGQTKYWPILNDATKNVVISANTSGNPRIDIIVVKMNTGTAPDDDASNVVEIEAVEGTPAASPAVPTTPNNSYKLAEIAVANGAVSIVTGDITDKRVRSFLDGSKLYFPNNSKGYFLNTSGNPDAYIYEDSSNILNIVSPTGNIYFLPSSGVVIRSGKTLFVNDAGNTKNGSWLHDGTNTVFATSSGRIVFQPNTAFLDIYADPLPSTAAGRSLGSSSLPWATLYTRTVTSDSGNALSLTTAANGDVVVIGRMPHSNNGSASAYYNRHTQTIFGYIEGDGSTGIGANFDFPVAFSTATTMACVVNWAGYKNGSTPSGPTDRTGVDYGNVVHCHATPVDTNTINVQIRSTTATFGAGNYYMFTGIIVGTQ